MSSPAQQTTKQGKNSLCRDIGHAWISTTASNFRVCKRKRCAAVQHFTQGGWIDIPSRVKKQPQHSPAQADFFSGIE
jgi:hypothetical protein